MREMGNPPYFLLSLKASYSYSKSKAVLNECELFNTEQHFSMLDPLLASIASYFSWHPGSFPVT
jgi:hypothetical protein